MAPLFVVQLLSSLVARFGGGQAYSGGSSSGSSSSSPSHSSSGSSSSGSSHSWDDNSSSSSESGSSGSSWTWTPPDFREISWEGCVKNSKGLILIGVVALGFFLFAFVKERRAEDGKDGAYLIAAGSTVLFGAFALMAGSAYGLLLVAIFCVASILSIRWAARLARLDFIPFWKPTEPSQPMDRVFQSEFHPSADLPLAPGYDRLLPIRVEHAWSRLQIAWGKQNLDDVRSFLSDGMQARTQIQLDAMRRRGVRNHLEDACVLGTEIVEVRRGERFTECTVRVVAQGRDVDSELGSMKIRSESPLETFKEFWTFLKRNGVKSPVSGLLEGACPSCGKSLLTGMSTICPSCKSIVKSGQFDWVLTEISQEGAWNPREEIFEELAVELILRDGSFVANAMEDHASLMFWSLIQAIPSHGDTIRHLTTDGCLESLLAAWSVLDDRDGLHLEPILGAVDVSEHEVLNDTDRLSVRLRWQLGPHTRLPKPRPMNDAARHLSQALRTMGRAAKVDLDALQSIQTKHDDLTVDRVTIFVFVRPVGQSTPEERMLTTAHCASCGGPATLETRGSCTWCGVDLGSQSGAWALAEIRPGNERLGV
jgi:hypothetical protein